MKRKMTKRSVMLLAALATSHVGCDPAPMLGDRLSRQLGDGIQSDDLAKLERHDSTISVHAQAKFPGETMSDWVSFSDQIAIVEVVSEQQMATQPDTVSKSRSVGRWVTLRLIDSLWVRGGGRPSISTGSEFQTKVFGWVIFNGKLAKARMAHSARMEVGGQYLVPLVHLDGEWAPLNPSSVTPVERSAIAKLDGKSARATSAARELRGLERWEKLEVLGTAGVRPELAGKRSMSPKQLLAELISQHSKNTPKPPPPVPVPITGVDFQGD